MANILTVSRKSHHPIETLLLLIVTRSTLDTSVDVLIYLLHVLENKTFNSEQNRKIRYESHRVNTFRI